MNNGGGIAQQADVCVDALTNQRTGRYFNRELGRYEFWIVRHGKSYLLGWCSEQIPPQLVALHEQRCWGLLTGVHP